MKSVWFHLIVGFSHLNSYKKIELLVLNSRFVK